MDMMVYNPAKILHLPKRGLDAGDKADLAVFDTDNEFVFDKSKMASKGRNTPYDGFKLFGETYMTIMEGDITYEKLC